MPSSATNPADDLDPLLRRAAQGDQESWRTLLERYEKRLRRMVALRLDARLQARLDPSDVLQEAYLEAWKRLDEYLQKPAMPFFLWLRLTAGQKLVELHRHHLGTRMRAAGREVSLNRCILPEASSAVLAAQLLGHDPRPSEVAVRAERKARLQEVLDGMDPLDREVVALRHFEQLSNAETARVLDLTEAAASKRYIRALQRLRETLTSLPDGGKEL